MAKKKIIQPQNTHISEQKKNIVEWKSDREQEVRKPKTKIIPLIIIIIHCVCLNQSYLNYRYFSFVYCIILGQVAKLYFILIQIQNNTYVSIESLFGLVQTMWGSICYCFFFFSVSLLIFQKEMYLKWNVKPVLTTIPAYTLITLVSFV